MSPIKEGSSMSAASNLWKTGTHMNRHPAGRDLTADIGAAPHGPEVLDRYPQVGTLTTTGGTDRSLPEPLERLLERFPVLRRHPHPMVVHFPIVFAISPVLFYLLYRITGAVAFEATAFHCLGAGLLFCVPAILTGFLTWWLNYQARPLRPVLIKIRFSGPARGGLSGRHRLPAPLPGRGPFLLWVGIRLPRAARGADPGRDRHRLEWGETDLSGGEKKVILRYQDLKTTQVYLGKINDTEAIRWMDILHGK